MRTFTFQLAPYALAAAGWLVLALGCSLQEFDALSSGLGAQGGSAGQSGAGGARAGAGGMAGSGGLAGAGAIGGSTSGGAGGSAGETASGGQAGSAGGTGGSPDAGPIGPVNLIADPSFEVSHLPWLGFAGAILDDVTTQPHSGSKCVAVTNRTFTYSSAAYPAESVVTAGETYEVGMWVRAESGQHNANITLKTLCDGGTDTYTPISSGTDVVGTDWYYLEAEFTVPPCPLIELRLYLEGPAIDVVIYIDDVSLYLVE